MALSHMWRPRRFEANGIKVASGADAIVEVLPLRFAGGSPR